VTHQIILKEGG